MKQTAVNWLISQVEDYIGLIPVDIIEQAKQMEKEQFMELLAWVSVQDVNRINEHYVNEIVQMFYDDKFNKQ